VVVEALTGAVRTEVLSVVVVEETRGVSSSTTVVQAGSTLIVAAAAKARSRVFFICWYSV
jgi:hypothetical protein